MPPAGAGLPEAHLTDTQVALLDQLSEALSGGGPAAQPAHGDAADADAFYEHWHVLKSRQRRLEMERRFAHWGWLDRVQEMCSTTCQELDSLLSELTRLDDERREVVRKTTALHEQCEQMVHDQEGLSSAAEELAERLDYYDRVADVARMLDQGNAIASHTEFSHVLNQLDSSIAFLESHHDFCQAQAYLHQFEHLRNRACVSMRSVVQRSLEKSMAQVEQQLRERVVSDGAVDTQVFYTRFRAAALDHKPLMSLLHQRIDVHESYAATLEELEAFYVHLRVRLISTPVTAHLQAVLKRDLQMSELAPATRQASSYILDISHFERQCFESYFELRQPQESLKTLLETAANIFYQALRPVAIACSDLNSLREIADCLQMDVLEPHQHSAKGDLVPVLATVYRLHRDVQERLIFCVEYYIRQEIRGFQAEAADLDYPAILYDIEPTSDVSAGSTPGSAESMERGWFPTMRRTLLILEKIYRVLEMTTFQGLAQEAVDLCIASLKAAALDIARRPPPPSAPGRPQALAALARDADAQLFLVRHLLALRERVAAFECDLVVSEKYFNFSNVWDALHLKLPDGLLGILKPKMHLSQVDSKKDIEAELKAACESLIANLTAHITQPLAALNGRIGEFLSRPGVERAQLKDQPFMAQEHLGPAVAGFLANVRERVPFVAAHIRLYLTAGGGASSAATVTAGAGSGGAAAGPGQSTASILFKPVEMRLVDTWGRLEGLFEECQMPAGELERLGFIRQSALRELVASLFESVMAAPWSQLVEAVAQAPRAAAAPAASAAEPPEEPPSAAPEPPRPPPPAPGAEQPRPPAEELRPLAEPPRPPDAAQPSEVGPPPSLAAPSAEPPAAPGPAVL